jgi:tetratricopeptide (TPR) repeat protein
MLERVAPYDLVSSDYFGLESAYIRGEAYLKAGQGQHAAAEFRKVLDHPGVVANSINAPLARVQLARAQEMMGDKEAARKSYQDFLTLWKDADPDIPIYKEAKAEYAKLMKSYQLSAVSHQ